MKNSMELGATPYEESCAQVGDNNYREEAADEMFVYIEQLYRKFPDCKSKNVYFKAHWNNHDFGVYGEVSVFWNTENEEADQYAYFIDQNLPANWDKEALELLEELRKERAK